VLSWAVTSSRVFGRLVELVGVIVDSTCRAHYFSTHGCSRFGPCFVDVPLEELASTAAAFRARMSKKDAMVWMLKVEVGD
jgi:hypothetical protein